MHFDPIGRAFCYTLGRGGILFPIIGFLNLKKGRHGVWVTAILIGDPVFILLSFFFFVKQASNQNTISTKSCMIIIFFVQNIIKVFVKTKNFCMKIFRFYIYIFQIMNCSNIPNYQRNHLTTKYRWKAKIFQTKVERERERVFFW